MQSPYRDTGPREANPSPLMGDGQVLAVPPMPPSSAGPVVWSRLAGKSVQFMRAVLDANDFRRKAGYLHGFHAERNSQDFLKLLARAGSEDGQPDDDPLLWSMRISAFDGPPASSSFDLQSHEFLALRRTLQTRIAAGSASHRAMAVWACGLLAPQREIGEICVQVRNQVRNNRSCCFPLPETAAWLNWFAIANAVYFPVPRSAVRSILHHRYRWQEIPDAPDLAPVLGEWVRYAWAKEDARNQAAKEAEDARRKFVREALLSSPRKSPSR